jgi:hypothetical protein
VEDSITGDFRGMSYENVKYHSFGPVLGAVVGYGVGSFEPSSSVTRKLFTWLLVYLVLFIN